MKGEKEEVESFLCMQNKGRLQAKKKKLILN